MSERKQSVRLKGYQVAALSRLVKGARRYALGSSHMLTMEQYGLVERVGVDGAQAVWQITDWGRAALAQTEESKP